MSGTALVACDDAASSLKWEGDDDAPIPKPRSAAEMAPFQMVISYTIQSLRESKAIVDGEVLDALHAAWMRHFDVESKRVSAWPPPVVTATASAAVPSPTSDLLIADLNCKSSTPTELEPIDPSFASFSFASISGVDCVEDSIFDAHVAATPLLSNLNAASISAADLSLLLMTPHEHVAPPAHTSTTTTTAFPSASSSTEIPVSAALPRRKRQTLRSVGNALVKHTISVSPALSQTINDLSSLSTPSAIYCRSITLKPLSIKARSSNTFDFVADNCIVCDGAYEFYVRQLHVVASM